MPNIYDTDVQFKIGTQSDYDSLSGLGLSGPDPSAIYFTTDTNNIYLGEVLYTDLYKGDVNNIETSYEDITVSGFYLSNSNLYYVLVGSPNQLYKLTGTTDDVVRFSSIDTSELTDSNTNVPSSLLIKTLLNQKADSSSLNSYYTKTDSDDRYAELNNSQDLAGARSGVVTAGLTNNNFSNEYRSKLDYLVNINLGNSQPASDFNETNESSLSYIFNKPLVEGTLYDRLPPVDGGGPKANLVSYDTFSSKVNSKLNKIKIDYEGKPDFNSNKFVEISVKPSKETIEDEDEKLVGVIGYKTIDFDDLGVKLAGDIDSRDWAKFSPSFYGDGQYKYVADLSGKVVESIQVNGVTKDLGSNGEVSLICATSAKVGDNLINFDKNGVIDLTNKFAKSVSAETGNGNVMQSVMKDDGDIDITNILQALTNLPTIPSEFDYLQVINGEVKFLDRKGLNYTNLDDDGEIKAINFDKSRAESGLDSSIKFDQYEYLGDYTRRSLLSDCSEGSDEFYEYYTFSSPDEDDFSKYNLSRDVSLDFQYSSVAEFPATLKVYPANVVVSLDNYSEEGFYNSFVIDILCSQGIIKTGRSNSLNSARIDCVEDGTTNSRNFILGNTYKFYSMSDVTSLTSEPADWSSEWNRMYYTIDSEENYVLNTESNWSTAKGQSGGLYKNNFSAKIKIPDLNDQGLLNSNKIVLIDNVLVDSDYDNSPINSYYFSEIDVVKNFEDYYTVRSIDIEYYGDDYIKVNESTLHEDWDQNWHTMYYTYDINEKVYLLNTISTWRDAVNQPGGLYRRTTSTISYDSYEGLESDSYLTSYSRIDGDPARYSRVCNYFEKNDEVYIQLLDPSRQSNNINYYLPTLEFKMNLSNKISQEDNFLKVEVLKYNGSVEELSSDEIGNQMYLPSSVNFRKTYPDNYFNHKDVVIYNKSMNRLLLYSKAGGLDVKTNSFLGNYLKDNSLGDIIKKYLLVNSLPGLSSFEFTGYYPEFSYKYDSINKYTNYVAVFSWSPLKVKIDRNEGSNSYTISSVDSLLNGIPVSYSTSSLVVTDIDSNAQVNMLEPSKTYKIEYVVNEILNFAIKISLPDSDELGDSFVVRIFNSKIENATDMSEIPDNSYYNNNNNTLRDEYYYVPVDHAYGLSVVESEEGYEEYRNYGNKTFLVDEELLNFKFNLYLVRNISESKMPPLFELSHDLSSGIPTATTSITRYKNNTQKPRLKFNFEGLYIVPYINNFKEEGGSN